MGRCGIHDGSLAAPGTFGGGAGGTARADRPFRAGRRSQLSAPYCAAAAQPRAARGGKPLRRRPRGLTGKPGARHCDDDRGPARGVARGAGRNADRSLLGLAEPGRAAAGAGAVDRFAGAGKRVAIVLFVARERGGGPKAEPVVSTPLRFLTRKERVRLGLYGLLAGCWQAWAMRRAVSPQRQARKSLPWTICSPILSPRPTKTWRSSMSPW